MVRKYSEIVAEQLRFAWARGDLTQGGLNNLATGLADSFKRDNPRFDHKRREEFLNACGYYRKEA